MGKQSKELNDELLVLRAKARETAALAELVRRWHGDLLAHARRLTRDWDGAEEVVQEAWMAVVKGIHKLNDPGAFAFWAFRIVGRESANWVHRRQRSRRDGNNDGLALAESRESVAAPDDAVARAMDALTVEHREVLALHYMQGMSVDQIAATLAIKEGTIKSRLHYAREAMRNAMGGEKGVALIPGRGLETETHLTARCAQDAKDAKKKQ
jgi:RNA polymerase sigma factor (sigma-70 family)